MTARGQYDTSFGHLACFGVFEENYTIHKNRGKLHCAVEPLSKKQIYNCRWGQQSSNIHHCMHTHPHHFDPLSPSSRYQCHSKYGARFIRDPIMHCVALSLQSSCVMAYLWIYCRCALWYQDIPLPTLHSKHFLRVISPAPWGAPPLGVGAQHVTSPTHRPSWCCPIYRPKSYIINILLPFRECYFYWRGIFSFMLCGCSLGPIYPNQIIWLASTFFSVRPHLTVSPVGEKEE